MRRFRYMLKRGYMVGVVLALVWSVVGCTAAAPDVKQMTLTQGTTVIEAAGFRVGQITYDQKSTGAAGSIISQSTPTGSVVALTVAGSPPVSAPNLGGLDRAKAMRSLASVELTLGVVTETYHASAPAGAVTSQTPAPGLGTPKGSAVAVVISKGPEPVAVPRVVGKTKADATSLLTTAGFKVKVTDKTSKAKKGTVIAQAPASGKLAQPGRTIVLSVSTGVVMVRVPRVIGMYPSDAAVVLGRAGLGMRRVNIHGPIDSDANKADFGEVYRQTPSAGTLVPRGTRVDVRSWWEYG